MDHVTRVRAWLKEQSYDGVILSRRDNFTWISGGAKNAVCTNAEAGIGYYVISAGEVKLLADSMYILNHLFTAMNTVLNNGMVFLQVKDFQQVRLTKTLKETH